MAQWLRFERDGRIGFGTLSGTDIAIHDGNMFSDAQATGETLPLSAVKLLPPTAASKIVALWNNFHALAEKLSLTAPEEPLYFLKTSTCFTGSGSEIRRPRAYDGRVVFEGELGIVIGKECRGVEEREAEDHIFGYCCINDVTAVDLLNKDPTFAQWTRAKNFDGFGAFGPVVATGLDPAQLTIRTVLNGDLRQDYPVSDMICPPRGLVSLISRDLTLLPGDVIACGTSIGAGSMKEPSNLVEVTIEGIGTLSNSFVQ